MAMSLENAITKAHHCGAAAAKHGDDESPNQDWSMLPVWDGDKSLTDPENNRIVYQAWLEGFREEMKGLAECRHCGHRVPKAESTLKSEYCDVCYIRYYAPDDVVRECVSHIRQTKESEE